MCKRRSRGTSGSGRGTIRSERAVVEKFGVRPAIIPDYLAVVGDAADDHPRIAGIGPAGAARHLNQNLTLFNIPQVEKQRAQHN